MAHAHLNYPDWWKPEYETGHLEPFDEFDVGASPFWVMALKF